MYAYLVQQHECREAKQARCEGRPTMRKDFRFSIWDHKNETHEHLAANEPAIFGSSRAFISVAFPVEPASVEKSPSGAMIAFAKMPEHNDKNGPVGGSMDGPINGASRNTAGRFTRGCKGGPGRPR